MQHSDREVRRELFFFRGFAPILPDLASLDFGISAIQVAGITYFMFRDRMYRTESTNYVENLSETVFDTGDSAMSIK